MLHQRAVRKGVCACVHERENMSERSEFQGSVERLSAISILSNGYLSVIYEGNSGV